MQTSKPIRSAQVVLEECTALHELGTTEIAKLASIGKVMQLAEGLILFHEGEPHGQLYFVTGGSIRLDMVTARCGRQTILSVGGGDLLAWSSLVGNGTMTATATANEDSEAVAFDAAALQILLEQDAKLGYLVMRVIATSLSRRLLATRLQLLDLYHK